MLIQLIILIFIQILQEIFLIFHLIQINSNITIKISNIIGAEVYSELKTSFIGEYIKQINLENLKGIYILEIKSEMI